MGIGAAMIMPATLSTITAVFPASKRNRAVSVWAGFASSGAILGMLTCGLDPRMVQLAGDVRRDGGARRGCVVAALVLAPNTADPDEAVIDVPGYLLSGIGIGALGLLDHRRH